MTGADNQQQASAHQDQAVAVSLRTAMRFVIGLMVVLAGLWVSSGVVSVPADRQAVVIGFGEAQVKARDGGGLVWWWPSPIGEVRLIPAASRKFSLDVNSFEPNGVSFDPRVLGYVMTGDHAVIHVGASVFWRVRDPISYAFLADAGETRKTREIDGFPKVEQAIRRALQRAVIHVAAHEDINTIRISGKDSIRRALIANMNDLLNARGTMPYAVTIENVEFNTSLPVWASDAFARAQRAQSEADQLIAEAESDRANALAAAQEEASQITGAARAVANEMISQAIVRTKPVSALAAVGTQDRDIVLYRLWREGIDQLFQQAQTVTIVPQHDNLRVLLPIQPPAEPAAPAADPDS